MGRQGIVVSKEEVMQIVHLLASTDMRISEIAQRMGRSKGFVRDVNGKFKVREYDGRRIQWTLISPK